MARDLNITRLVKYRAPWNGTIGYGGDHFAALVGTLRENGYEITRQGAEALLQNAIDQKLMTHTTAAFWYGAAVVGIDVIIKPKRAERFTFSVTVERLEETAYWVARSKDQEFLGYSAFEALSRAIESAYVHA